MCLLVPPFLSTTNSLCQGTHESYNEWKLEITETDGRHLFFILLHTQEEKIDAPIHWVISYATVWHCIVQTVSAVEQRSCQQGDEIQQCSSGSATGTTQDGISWGRLNGLQHATNKDYSCPWEAVLIGRSSPLLFILHIRSDPTTVVTLPKCWHGIRTEHVIQMCLVTAQEGQSVLH